MLELLARLAKSAVGDLSFMDVRFGKGFKKIIQLGLKRRFQQVEKEGDGGEKREGSFAGEVGFFTPVAGYKIIGADDIFKKNNKFGT